MFLTKYEKSIFSLMKIQDWFLLLCKFVILDKMTFSLGGGEEQAAAATVSALLCVQLGGGAEGAESFKMLCPSPQFHFD